MIRWFYISIELPNCGGVGGGGDAAQNVPSGHPEPAGAADDGPVRRCAHGDSSEHGEGAAVVLAGGEDELQRGEAGEGRHVGPDAEALLSAKQRRARVHPSPEHVVVDEDVAEPVRASPVDGVHHRGVGHADVDLVEVQVQVLEHVGADGRRCNRDEEEEGGEKRGSCHF